MTLASVMGPFYNEATEFTEITQGAGRCELEQS
jgi:hypothetical protein